VVPTGPGASLTLLGLATLLEMKAFLSHRHCQAMLDGWWRVDRPSTPRCSLPEDTSYPLLLCQALVPLPSFNPFVLRIEGRHGARAQAEVHEGDFAAQELIGFNAWSAAMSLAIKLRRMSVLPPGPPEPAPAARPDGSGAAAAQGGEGMQGAQGAQGAQGGSAGSAAAQARWATSKAAVLGSPSRLGLVALAPSVRLLGGESKQRLRTELRQAQQQMREQIREHQQKEARVAAGTDALQQEGAAESLLTRLTGVRLRLAFYSVPMTKF